MNQRELIVSALEKMGPTRATRMLAAFDPHHTNLGGWFDCPFALCYGKRGELVQHYGFETTIIEGDEEIPILAVTPEIVAELFGITPDEVRSITRAFDGAWNSEVGKGELERLIRSASEQPIGTVEAA